MPVDLLHVDFLRRALDPDRLGVDHRGSRELTDVDLPAEPG
jgi:hypothetical protein